MKAFQRLKEVFYSATTLCLPDPTLPLLVEGDASTTGLDNVLSQRKGMPSHLHLWHSSFGNCPRRSKIVTSETGNRWQSNWPLEEWRHWLDGAQSQFSSQASTLGPILQKI
ncbi:MAG: RNase H-like domain-containing protein [Aeromonas sp.]